jgi:hypothetical protein
MRNDSVVARNLGLHTIFIRGYMTSYKIVRTMPLLLALGVVAFATTANAQTTPKPAAPAVKKAAPKKPVSTEAHTGLEPKAIDILKASSAKLASAQSMSFTAVVTYESPTRVGFPLSYTTKSDVVLQRPNKLRVITLGDGPASEFYYDGKSMMAYSPAEDMIAVADAPPTVDATLETAYHKAAIYFPFDDVLVTDPYKDIAADLRLAFYVGQSNVVGGVKTDIVAYDSGGVFIEAWIGAEDKLPRMLRAVYADDPLLLRHQLEITNWQLEVSPSDDQFTTPKAATAKHIQFASPDPAPAKAKAAAKPAQQSKAQ